MTGKQLKDSILQMAVQGKLIPQNPQDEPASVLIEHIQAEKERMIKNGKINKDRNLFRIFRGSDKKFYEQIDKQQPLCIEAKLPFEIPESWEWVHLLDICEYIQRGKSPKYSPIEKYPVIAQKCNQWDGFSIRLAKFIDPDTIGSYTQERFLQDKDLLWNSTGLGTLGRIAVYKIELNPYGIAVADSHVTVIRSIKTYVNPYFLYYYFSNPSVQRVIEAQSDGTTKQKELALNTVKNYLVPLPPKNEQDRIVKKIEELLPCLNKYSKREEQVQQLNTNFPDKLKKSILQYAVQGKLVPQNPQDEPASVLLEHIHKEKEKLIQEGKIKRDKHESFIFRRGDSYYEKSGETERCIDEEIPFDIPRNWEWCRLKNIFNVVSAQRVHRSDWRTNGVPFFRAREIAKLANDGYVENDLFISEELYSQLTSTGVPNSGDLMITAVGTLGKTYIVKSTDRFYYKDASVICFENFGGIEPKYMKSIMESPFMLNQIKGNVAGTTVATITIIKAKEYLLPIPPLAEQKRLVRKIEEIFSIIN